MDTGPLICITPNDCLIDEIVNIRLSGFEPHQKVTLHAALDQMPNLKMRASSYAQFDTNENGQVDVGRQTPLSGTYSEADAMGMFWSMQVSNSQYNLTKKLSELGFERTSKITFTAEVGDEIVARGDLIWRHVSTDVQIEDVMEDGIVGKFFYPAGTFRRPGVIVLGGGEGGLATPLNMAALFASHGFPSLALAYFDFEHLPQSLREIPLEYFQRAIQWLQKQGSVHPLQISVFGRSKGAELALLLGATYPEIGAVIASSPNSVVCIGDFTEEGNHVQTYSSWSHQGIPLSFVDWTPEACREFVQCMHERRRVNHLHKDAFMDATELEECIIPVEKINGPVLLISGDDDHWWDTTFHCGLIMNRLHQSNFAYEKSWLNYEGAGHGIRYPNIPATQLSLNGGSAYLNAMASRHSWEHVVRFLESSFL